MYLTVNFYGFEDAFRGCRENSFSYEGKKALFSYLEELEEDTGEQIELDIIGLCCEYTEYTDIENVKEDYPDIKDIEDLINYTQVIEFKEGIIIHVF